MNGLTIAVVVLSCVVAAFIVSLFFRADDKVEGRRKVAFEIAGVLAKVGLDDFVPLAKCYTIGDYTGIVAELEKVVDQLKDTERATRMFEKLFYNQLADRLADPVEKIKILAEVAKKPADLTAAATAASTAAATPAA